MIVTFDTAKEVEFSTNRVVLIYFSDIVKWNRAGRKWSTLKRKLNNCLHGSPVWEYLVVVSVCLSVCLSVCFSAQNKSCDVVRKRACMKWLIWSRSTVSKTFLAIKDIWSILISFHLISTIYFNEQELWNSQQTLLSWQALRQTDRQTKNKVLQARGALMSSKFDKIFSHEVFSCLSALSCFCNFVWNRSEQLWHLHLRSSEFIMKVLRAGECA